MKKTLIPIALLALFAVAHTTRAAVIIDGSLVAWWDASDINNGGANPANGATITDWKDKSGNGRDLNNGGNGTYNTTAVGGLPAVEFSTSQWLYTGSNITSEQLAGTNRNEITIFMVLNRQAGVVWSKWETASTNRVGFEGGNRFDMVNDGIGQLSGTDISNSWTVYEGLKSTTTQSIFVNGGIDASTPNALSLAASTSSPYIVGANSTGNSLSADIDFAEIIVYNRELSTAERNQVGSFLAGKYGISSQYIPEPGSAALLGLGAAGLLLRRRRK